MLCTKSRKRSLKWEGRDRFEKWISNIFEFNYKRDSSEMNSLLELVRECECDCDCALCRCV